MSVIHAEFAPGFDSGHDAVLLAMDDAGVSDMLAAVTQAAQRGSARLDHGATTHRFLIEPSEARVDFHDATVVWRLDAAKAAEIIELLTEMHDHPGKGHHYVEDIVAPAPTIVLSLNEYLDGLPAEATFPPVA
jgi:hypothetical protein